MIDFNFNDRLVANPMRRNIRFSFDTLQNSNINLINSKMVPIVKLQGNWDEPKEPLDTIQVCNYSQFGRGAWNKDRIYELMNIAHYPMLAKISDVEYYIGKGFIGLAFPGRVEIIPLMVMVVPESNYNLNNPADITILVDNRYKTQPVPVKTAINQYLVEHGVLNGDIIVTSEITKYLSGKLRFPKFANIRAKKVFVETFIEQCVGAL